MKQHKKLLINLVFAAVILAAAAVLLLVRKANQTGAPLCAELIYGDGSCFDGTGLTVDVERPLTADEQVSYYDYTLDTDPQIQRAVSTAQQLTGVTTVGGVNDADIAADSAAASSEAAAESTASSEAAGEAEASSEAGAEGEQEASSTQ